LVVQRLKRDIGEEVRHMSKQNKAIARQVYEVFASGDLDALDELISADAVDHDTQNPHRDIHGPEGSKRVISMYRAAFPDLRITVEDQIAEGDKVVTRWIAVGTHDGDLPGLPASGNKTNVTGIGIDRFEDGKIVEAWNNWDTLGMMQQLGAVPAGAAAA
jgi:steroid delta-isomerase-like uncharacterized protein